MSSLLSVQSMLGRDKQQQDALFSPHCFRADKHTEIIKDCEVLESQSFMLVYNLSV